MGIVYYANYYIWFEIGRTDFCRQQGFAYREMEEQDGLFIMVAEVTVPLQGAGALRRRNSGPHLRQILPQARADLRLRNLPAVDRRDAGGG